MLSCIHERNLIFFQFTMFTILLRSSLIWSGFVFMQRIISTINMSWQHGWSGKFSCIYEIFGWYIFFKLYFINLVNLYFIIYYLLILCYTAFQKKSLWALTHYLNQQNYGMLFYYCVIQNLEKLAVISI